MLDPDTRQRVLDPTLAERVRALGYQARRVAEGLLSGIHRSPHRGASVVFVEHREYRAGDDPRLLDWRAAARTDRLVLKRFEQETQLRAHLVLDRSASMAFPPPDARDPEARSKRDHGATLLGALAYLLLRQGDAVGAALLDAEVGPQVPPRSRPAHLDVVLSLLAGAEPVPRTALGPSLGQLAERAGRRGLVVLASDLVDFDDHALDPLGVLVARGHDVVVLQILTPEELELPDRGAGRYVGLEGEPPIDSDADAIRDAYRDEVARFLEDRRRACVGLGARWVLARTDRAPEDTLAAALGLGDGAFVADGGRD